MIKAKNDKYETDKKYLNEDVHIFLKPLVVDIIKKKPVDVLDFIIFWCQTRKGQQQLCDRKPLTDKKSVTNIQLPIKKQLDSFHANNPQQQEKTLPNCQSETRTPDSTENEEDILHEENQKEMEWLQKRHSQKKKKMAISAEVYAQENIKDFVPRVVPKTIDQIEKIKFILGKNFMFNGLDGNDQQIVINAMEIKDYQTGDLVIKQGDDGNELFIVDNGLLKCTQKRANLETEVFLKNYEPGGLFGELALMYNVPRAASITALEPSRLFALDRQTFNNIVKVSVMKQRERFEAFLEKIDILKDLNMSEKAKICDCLRTERFARGELVIKEKEIGDKFYLVQEGTAEAFKLDERGQEMRVFEYKENDYFGELALLGGNFRKASIRVTSEELVVASIDKESFKRLLGPIETILERNSERYKKYTNK